MGKTSPITRLTKIVVVILLLATTISISTSAQTSSDVRVEMAVVLSDGTLKLQVAVPRGQTIEQATITVDGNNVELTAQPIALSVNQWMFLDSSERVINTATTIQAAVERFLQGNDSETQVGLIFYALETQLYQPSSSMSEVGSWLDQYSVYPGQPGCINDAINTLAEIPRPLDKARHIMLIAGNLSRQGLCTATDALSVSAPIDIIVLSEEVDPLYYDLIERSGGNLFRANLQTVQARVNEVKTLWSRPVYLLESSTPLSGSARSGQLQLTLSNGSSISVRVRLESFTSSETVEDTSGLQTMPSLATPTTNGVQPPTEVVVASTTVLAATVPQMTSAQPSLTQVATESIVAVAPTTVEVQNVATTTTNDADATGSEVISSPTEDSQAASNQTDDDQPETVDTPLPEDASTEAQTTVTSTDDDITPQLVVIMLLGALGGIVLVMARQWRKSRIMTDTDLDNDATQQPEVALTEEEEFYNLGDQPTPSESASGVIQNSMEDEVDITEMDEAEEDDDELLDQTEIVTEDDLIASTKSLVTGILKLDGTSKQYEIQRVGTLLGRESDCDIAIKDDKQLSRKHVKFETSDDNIISLRILTSNPILINGERAAQKQSLNLGDVLQLSQKTRMILVAVGDDE